MKFRSRSATWHRLGVIACAAGLVWLAGCIIIPVDYHAPGSRRNVNPKTQGQLRLGETTKEDLFLMLGEPDHASEDGQRLGYAWTKVKAIWAVAGMSGGASGEIQHSYVLEASFDTSNRMSRLRLLKAWGSGVPPARELEKPR
jgi:hypothetical protein